MRGRQGQPFPERKKGQKQGYANPRDPVLWWPASNQTVKADNAAEPGTALEHLLLGQGRSEPAI
jgi:hypothetical protein